MQRIEEEEGEERSAIPSPTIQVLKECLRHVHVTLPSVQTRRRTALVREHRKDALVQRRIKHGSAREETDIVSFLLHRGEEDRRDGLSAEVLPIDARQSVEHREDARARSVATAVMAEEAGGALREFVDIRRAERIHRRGAPSVEGDDNHILARLGMRQWSLRVAIAFATIIRSDGGRLHLTSQSGEQRVRIEGDARREVAVQKDQLAIVLGERHSMPALNEADQQAKEDYQRVDDRVWYLIRDAEGQFEEQHLNRQQEDEHPAHHEILGDSELEDLRRSRSEHLFQDVGINMETIEREYIRVHRENNQEEGRHQRGANQARPIAPSENRDGEIDEEYRKEGYKDEMD